MEKLVWVPIISFCKKIILSYTFDPLLCSKQAVLAPKSRDFPDNSITHRRLTKSMKAIKLFSQE